MKFEIILPAIKKNRTFATSNKQQHFLYIIKKINVLAITVLLMAAGTANAQRQHKDPLAPKDTRYECQWDSTYTFEEDSVYDMKEVIQERDAVNNTMTVYSYEWKKNTSSWKDLCVYKYCYDNLGRVALVLSCEPENFEGEIIFNDSSIYTYGNRELTVEEYFNNGSGFYKNSATHYTYDALDSIIEEIDYQYDYNLQTIKPYRRYTHTYDPTTHLTLTDSTFKYVDSQWNVIRFTHYVIEDGKYTFAYLMDVKETGVDTSDRLEYTYNGTTETAYEYDKEDGVWTATPEAYRVRTFNACGGEESSDIYEYDEEDGRFEYSAGVHYYYSVDSAQVGIEEIGQQAEITLAPNPVKVGAPITLTFNSGSVATVDIYSTNGVLVNSVKANTNTVSLSSPKVAGMYIVRFTSASGKSSSTLVVR